MIVFAGRFVDGSDIMGIFRGLADFSVGFLLILAMVLSLWPGLLWRLLFSLDWNVEYVNWFGLVV